MSETVKHAETTPDTAQPYRELGAGGTTADDLADAGVLVLLEAELCPRLLDLGGVGCVRDGVERGLVGLDGHALAIAFRTEVKNGSPSVEGP